MTLEELLIALIRIVGSLPVLFLPFAGGLLAIGVDQSDLFIMNLVHLGGVRDYQVLDKYLDQVYLFAFLVVSRRWSPRLRAVSLALYIYRLVGFVTFELTEARWVLLAFPNFFEFWFLGVAGLKQFNLDQRLNKLQFGSLAVLFFAVKIFQEYAIHYRRWLDGFTAVEAVQSVWRWFTHPF